MAKKINYYVKIATMYWVEIISLFLQSACNLEILSMYVHKAL